MSPGTQLLSDLAVVLLGAAAGGLAARRAGVSPVIGYLAAGALIGPASPLVPLVAEAGRVEAVSQLGLVFLMFDIGRRLGWQRLKRLGVAVVFGGALGVLAVLQAGRLAAGLAGFSGTGALFAAALMVVSSSAIIGKLLEETGAARERAGQLALGVTVLEDMAAVALLAVLGTAARAGQGGGPEIGELLGGLGVFVAAVFLGALLAVPRFIALLARRGSQEIEAAGVAGLLLGMSALAVHAGYSAALGAFLMGSIIGSTRERAEAARHTAAARDIFGAVFFVAAGMMFDARSLAEVWPVALGLTAAAMALRWLLIGTALVMAGQPPADAYRAGIYLTPLGEFSFIIAQLGAASGSAPEWFFAAAVTMSLGSSLAAPALARHAGAVNRAAGRLVPQPVPLLVRTYLGWLEAARRLLAGSVVWKLAGRRLWQIGIEMAAVTALVLGAGWVVEQVAGVFGRDFLVPNGVPLLTWFALAFLAAIPLVAVWRNIEAVAMIFAEALGRAAGGGGVTALRAVLRVAGGLVFFVWLGAVLPAAAGGGLVASFFAGAVAAILLFRQRLIRWHSLAEIELAEVLSKAGTDRAGLMESFAGDPGREWNIAMRDFRVRDLSRAAGLRISDLPLRAEHGASIAAVERQGLLVPNPRSDFLLFPGDRLLLLGSAEGIRQAARWLESPSDRPLCCDGEYEELRFSEIRVAERSPVAGKTLAEAGISPRFGAQIAGVERAGKRFLSPGGDFRLESGDTLLALGLRKPLADLERWVSGAGSGS